MDNWTVRVTQVSLPRHRRRGQPTSDDIEFETDFAVWSMEQAKMTETAELSDVVVQETIQVTG